MQANPYGTWTEQRRYKMGFVTVSARKVLVAQGEVPQNARCGNCAHVELNHGEHCSKGNFATRVGCWCKAFEPNLD